MEDEGRRVRVNGFLILSSCSDPQNQEKNEAAKEKIKSDKSETLKTRTPLVCGLEVASSQKPEPTRMTKLGIKMELPDECKKDMRRAFDLFTTDNHGLLNRSVLQTSLRALGLQSSDEINEMIPSSGKIDYADFLRVMTHQIFQRDSREQLESAFELLDDDNTGDISLENLRRVAAELDVDVTDDELMDMIDLADIDNDDNVSKEDFLRFFSGKLNKKGMERTINLDNH